MVTDWGFGECRLPQNLGSGQTEQRLGPLAERVIANRLVLVLRRALRKRAFARNYLMLLYFTK
jgi:hypothetical protein